MFHTGGYFIFLITILHHPISAILLMRSSDMFFKKKQNIIFRDYQNFSYITDNRDYSYLPSNGNNIGDKILSESGTIFYLALKDYPQQIEDIANEIKKSFANVDTETIVNDAKDFLNSLHMSGFIAAGNTKQECLDGDKKFSYNILNQENSEKKYEDENESTIDFFDKHFQGKYQLKSVHIEIISKCNERCVHCYIPHENKIAAMEAELFFRIIQQCKEMNVLHLTLSGGEPMLHKHFSQFLRKCRHDNFSINILSNLTLLSDDILREMKKNPLLGVQTSLYSMNPVIHDDITRKKGSFEKTKASILKLINNNIPLQISCPIMKQNRESYKGVLDWAKAHRIQIGDDYSIIANYNHSTENLSCRLSLDEIEAIIKDKINSSENFSEEQIITKKDPEEFICSVCNSSICISETGNIYPCAGWQGYSIGNINTSELDNVWNNSAQVNYLRNLRLRDFPECLKCTQRDFCTMCMVRNSNEDKCGDPLKVNKFFCDVARIKKQIIVNKIGGVN